MLSEHPSLEELEVCPNIEEMYDDIPSPLSFTRYWKLNFWVRIDLDLTSWSFWFFSHCDGIQDSSYDELALCYNLKKVVLRSIILWYREGGVGDTSILEEVRKKWNW